MSTLQGGLVAISLLALAGCNSPPAKTGFTEGTRLKAVYLEADGAPPLFLNWYDTVLGVDCKFADVGLPDRLVCFPANPPFSDSFNMVFGNRTEFLTPNGDDFEPLVAIWSRTGFLLRGPKPEDPCGTPVQLFALGPEVTDPASVFTTDRDGKVVGINSLENPFTPKGLHPVGAEIPLDSLVTGTYQPGAGPGRIVPLTIVASDGSVQVAGTRGRVEARTEGEIYPGVASQQVAWDKERDEMVWAYLAELYDGPGIRWYPFTDTFVWGFADAACSARVAVGPGCSFRARAALESWGSSTACSPGTPAFFDVGAPIPRASVYREEPDMTCVFANVPDARDFDVTREAFALGAPIPVTAFADVTQVRTGTKQLQLDQVSGADGAGAYPVGLFDTLHGVRCSTSFNEGGPCLPDASEFLADNGFFADAACTVPLVTNHLACSPKPGFAVRAEPTPQWDPPGPRPIPVRHIYALGERHLGAFYDRRSGPCAPIETDVAPEERNLFLIGPELPASDFASVKLVRPD